ncbi:type IX secretion system outer membrane channel protein PorV [Bacteroidales bacterium OttesenSCG-928-M06]|nr:type IX secretion system outer membrane channel protein PorV [Bacteroidales bacterium OttesenSCG-928-M06]
MSKYRFVLLILAVLTVGAYAKAADDNIVDDNFNPLRTGVPSLSIAPDARGGAMGDIGAATDPDVTSQYWNPAKYAFAYSKAGVSLTYTPWLSKLVDDIDLVYLSGFYKLGDADRHAIGASLRYFSLGNVKLTDISGNSLQDISPYEMSIDVSYSLKATETFSLAGAFRFIYSDLGGGAAENLNPGTAVAADIAGYYNNYVMMGSNECLLGLGFNISNIGNKVTYDDGGSYSFLPTNLRVGGSLLFPLDDYNTLSINADANKLLVPTPPKAKWGATDEETKKMWEEYQSQSPITGIFKSFSDAPGGFKEELEEVTWSLGAEYAYDNQFFVRGGYFHESQSKGNRQYFSLGAGFKLTAFQLDVAYLISTVPSNPLDQTLRFSLSFDMDGLKTLMR